MTTTAPSLALLPCPFCGGAAEWGHHDCHNGEHHRCTECGVEIRGDAAAWNTRAALQADPVAVSSLDRAAINLLVAAGYVTQFKANHALSIAHGFDAPPLDEYTAPPAAAPAAERRCYQCSGLVAWLAPDGRCNKCTRYVDLNEPFGNSEQLPAAVPSGWQLVPVVMSLDMEIAFCEAWFAKRRAIDDAEMQDAYAAMLAAAPRPAADEVPGKGAVIDDAMIERCCRAAATGYAAMRPEQKRIVRNQVERILTAALSLQDRTP